MGATIAVAVSVNGVQYERNVEPRLLLSDFIRQDLGLTDRKSTRLNSSH